jgi:hypothetical protein
VHGSSWNNTSIFAVKGAERFGAAAQAPAGELRHRGLSWRTGPHRIWPQVIDAMGLVKPAIILQWHRNKFRLHWRWRSRRSSELRSVI